jgi:serine protease Do
MRNQIFYYPVLILFFMGCNASSDNNIPHYAQPFDFTEAAKIATPAVVHINTYATDAPGSRNPLEEFLRQREEQADDEEMQITGLGSGVIISDDGYIVTVNHILEHAEKIVVSLNDKRIYTAEVVGADPATDLALLKIDDKELPKLEFGRAVDLQVGEWVVAVGNPFNLTSTVTAGIVSAKGRELNILEGEEGRSIESFIQTDAALNPGNSGGALVNTRGELVGINAAIASPTGAFAGYSFAVPVNLVKKVVNDIIEFGEVRRGTLGVDIRDLNPRLAVDKDLEDLSGVYVEKVINGSPAELAGIRQGDIILSVEGREVDSAGEMQEIVALKRPGDELKITYRRKGRERQTEVKLADN